MRRLLLLLPILVVLGCSSSGHSQVTDKDAQAAIARLFTKDAAESPANPSCAGTPATAVGASVKCTASDRSGAAWPITVRVAKIEGGIPDVEAAFDAPVVTIDDAKTKITETYRTYSQNDVASIDCKGLQKLAVDSTRKCTVNEVGGKSVPVTFQVSAVTGEKYSYTVNIGQ
ncbi:hypothetical protein ABIA39_001355 [Nocardia sp. GAS34]|uniref:DUF4333 domain-containing protein n=1 Tax=unclassified Nocardia TaxID=2637762 RepID=UPI003D25EB54